MPAVSFNSRGREMTVSDYGLIPGPPGVQHHIWAIFVDDTAARIQREASARILQPTGDTQARITAASTCTQLKSVGHTLLSAEVGHGKATLHKHEAHPTLTSCASLVDGCCSCWNLRWLGCAGASNLHRPVPPPSVVAYEGALSPARRAPEAGAAAQHREQMQEDAALRQEQQMQEAEASLSPSKKQRYKPPAIYPMMRLQSSVFTHLWAAALRHMGKDLPRYHEVFV